MKPNAPKKQKGKSKSEMEKFGDFDNGRSLLRREGKSTASNAELPMQQAAANGLPQSNDFAIIGQQALRAEGRNSVNIDFPVEGKAIYFQKLKGHAEISVSSALPSDSKKGPYFLWLIGIATALLAGRELLSRRTKLNPVG